MEIRILSDTSKFSTTRSESSARNSKTEKLMHDLTYCTWTKVSNVSGRPKNGTNFSIEKSPNSRKMYLPLFFINKESLSIFPSTQFTRFFSLSFFFSDFLLNILTRQQRV